MSMSAAVPSPSSAEICDELQIVKDPLDQDPRTLSLLGGCPNVGDSPSRPVSHLKVSVVQGRGLLSELNLPGNAYVRVTYVPHR